MTFFSVLIPVFKTSKYLRECIESVLTQTYDNYEIVLLDDGSPDDSSVMCDLMAAESPKIRVVHKTNEGLMMTRRKGFQTALGEYFICLDSDDYLCDKNALEKINDLIEKTKCDLVLYDYIKGEENSERIVNLFGYNSGHVFDSKQEVYERLLTSNQMNNIWLKCPKREIVDIDVDYSQWKEAICRAEDLFQSYPILNNAKKVGYIAEPLYFYRWTEGSISNKPKYAFIDSYKQIFQREDKYIHVWNISDEAKKVTKSGRVLAFCDVVIAGYYQCNNKATFGRWRCFVEMLSKDEVFLNSMKDEWKDDVKPYYRVLYRLIKSRKYFLIIALIMTVECISKMKHRGI